MTKSSKYTAQLALRTEFGSLIGDTRIRLLEAIGRCGSIAQAARQLPLSYKSAWDAVDEMNNLSEHPLVERTIGGAAGGGTQLTGYGHRLVALYRALEGESQEATDRLVDAEATLPADSGSFRRLLRRLSVRTSARNQFYGTIAEVRQGAVNAQVRLTLDEAQPMWAQITRESVETMGLQRGQEVLALIKAPAMLLLADPQVRTSAENHFAGTISRIEHGPFSSELVVDLALPVARHVTAVVTTDIVRTLGLQLGGVVGVAFAATNVILAVLG